MNGEEWRWIPEYKNFYQVSSKGQVYSCPRLNAHGHQLRGRILVQTPSKKGGPTVTLYKNSKRETFKVPRLVAEVFIGYSHGILDHIDGDTNNNCVENLKYSDSTINNSGGLILVSLDAPWFGFWCPNSDTAGEKAKCHPKAIWYAYKMSYPINGYGVTPCSG